MRQPKFALQLPTWGGVSFPTPASKTPFFPLLKSGAPTIILSEVCCRYSDEFVSELAPEGQFHGLLDCGFYIP